MKKNKIVQSKNWTSNQTFNYDFFKNKQIQIMRQIVFYPKYYKIKSFGKRFFPLK